MQKIYSVKITLWATIIFLLLLIINSALFYMLPFLTPLLAAGTLVLFGIILLIIVAISVIKIRSKESILVMTLLIIGSLSWYFLPTRELAIATKFTLERSNYESIVAQLQQGDKPDCLSNIDCMISEKAPGYVVFPWPGFLNGWPGVVYVPDGNTEQLSTSNTFASIVNCESNPRKDKFYFCMFY